VVAVIDVLLTTTTPVAAVPPNVTVTPVMKFEPVMVTAVPPLTDAELGAIALTVGGGLLVVKLNPWANVPLCEPTVTTTFTAPAAWAAVVAVIDVLLTTTTLAAAVPPNVTVAPDWNPVPVIVTAVPPLASPVFGETEVTVGAGEVPCPPARKVAICITQVPDDSVAVAL